MNQAERLTRLSEILVELFRSPVPTHFFQTLGDQAFAAVPNDYLAVCLRDPEKGIPARDLPHVFDKSYRVESKATREIAGTGLGLAITRSIVEAYGGRISVESVEGAGTTFVVELPLARS